MIFIWGTKGSSRVLEKGEFECPECNINASYKLKSVRKYFAVYWISIFPLGGREYYLECQNCDSAFDPSSFYSVDELDLFYSADKKISKRNLALYLLLIAFIVMLSSIYHVRHKPQKKLHLQNQQQSQQREFLAQVKEQTYEVLTRELRQVIFENQMSSDASVSVAFFNADGEDEMQDNLFSSGEVGWMVYFSPGTLQVKFNDKMLNIDLSAAHKGHYITILADGSMVSSKYDLNDL